MKDKPTRSEAGYRPIAADLTAEAKRIRAQADLDQVRTARLIVRALNCGHPPAQIAADLGIPADLVDRTTRQVRAGRDFAEVRPSEIINMYVAGEITGQSAMWRLADRTYPAGQYGPSDGYHYKRGGWDDIEAALGRGLINERHYNWLLANCDLTVYDLDRSRGPQSDENIAPLELLGQDLTYFARAADMEVQRATDRRLNTLPAQIRREL